MVIIKYIFRLRGIEPHSRSGRIRLMDSQAGYRGFKSRVALISFSEFTCEIALVYHEVYDEVKGRETCTNVRRNS